MARPSDAAALAALQVAAQKARAPLLPAGALGGLTPDAVLPSWLDLLGGGARVLIALAGSDEGERTVGAAVYGPATDPDRDPAHDVELAVLLVDPPAARQGHGSRLLAAVADTARDSGGELLVTWVLERDEPMQAFLTGAGWDADGSRRELEAGGLVAEIRMRTQLAAASRT
jgi:GNAT superfamily N-acetyltransferase